MSYFVTCVKHLFLHFTVTFARLTSVRPVWGSIYQMILNFTQWYQSNIGNRFQCIFNAQSILQNYANSIVSNVTFLFVFNAFSPRNIRLTMQQIFYIFRKERKKPYKKIQKSQEKQFIPDIKRQHQQFWIRRPI